MFQLYADAESQLLATKKKEWRKSIRAEKQRRLRAEGASAEDIAVALNAKIDLEVPYVFSVVITCYCHRHADTAPLCPLTPLLQRLRCRTELRGCSEGAGQTSHG